MLCFKCMAKGMSYIVLRVLPCIGDDGILNIVSLAVQESP